MPNAPLFYLLIHFAGPPLDTFRQHDLSGVRCVKMHRTNRFGSYVGNKRFYFRVARYQEFVPLDSHDRLPGTDPVGSDPR